MKTMVNCIIYYQKGVVTIQPKILQATIVASAPQCINHNIYQIIKLYQIMQFKLIYEV